MIRLPLLEVCGQSETWVVWMSESATPAFLSAATIVRASEEWRLTACAAVAPFVVTPKSKEARSGVASTVPLPITVMVVPADGVAERPRCGCATPAIAAAASSTPASRRIVRSLFMQLIRRCAFRRHTYREGVTLHAPSTWHHGLIADHWALVNLDAPEVDIYERHLRSPVLDAGCGAGRLLAPLRDRGFDIDGCDLSADMIERCGRRVPDATLWVS